MSGLSNSVEDVVSTSGSLVASNLTGVCAAMNDPRGMVARRFSTMDVMRSSKRVKDGRKKSTANAGV
jgi:hypothetical protein